VNGDLRTPFKHCRSAYLLSKLQVQGVSGRIDPTLTKGGGGRTSVSTLEQIQATLHVNKLPHQLVIRRINVRRTGRGGKKFSGSDSFPGPINPDENTRPNPISNMHDASASQSILGNPSPHVIRPSAIPNRSTGTIFTIAVSQAWSVLLAYL